MPGRPPKGNALEVYKVTQHLSLNVIVGDKNEKMRLREANSKVRTLRPSRKLGKMKSFVGRSE